MAFPAATYYALGMHLRDESPSFAFSFAFFFVR